MDSMDWREIAPGDRVTKTDAGYVFTSMNNGVDYLATLDQKSRIMAERHLKHWSEAGECTRTLAEARRLAASRRGRQ